MNFSIKQILFLFHESSSSGSFIVFYSEAFSGKEENNHIRLHTTSY